MPYYYILSSRALWRWKHRRHLRAYRAYRRRAPALTPLQERIVNDLHAHGIAFTHVNEFFGEDVLSELQAAASALIDSGTRTSAKDFLKYFLRNYGDPADLDSPMARRMLDPRILGIISDYFATFARLIFFSGNVAIPVRNDVAPKKSQCWHRDGGLYKLCKIFIYLNDVGETSGPFTYLAQTQPGGAWSRFVAHKFFGHGSYYPAEARVGRGIRRYGLEEHVLRCTGEAGTMIFCNTLGLHRGGYATERERIMLTWEYDYAPLQTPVHVKFARTRNLAEKTAALHPLAQRAIRDD
jgi:hypothetical protein